MADIKETLRLHAMWTAREEGGVRADLYGANLYGADLCEANLYGADLYGANLRGANLCEANLYGADLYGANLRGANLCGANLCEANLYGADLYGANLRGANLCWANLCGANLWSVRGNGSQIKSLQIGKYDVAYTAEVLQIGCQCKPIAKWFSMDSIPGRENDDAEWLVFRPLIKQIIEQYPATPTGKEKYNG